MASVPNPTLSKSNFHNWVKAALAILFTKEEIEPIVYDEIVQFHQKMLQDISISNGLPVGSTCSSCYTENIVACPTNKICNVNRGQCGFHRNSATQFHPSGCPNKICHRMRSEIQKAHRFNGPSYKNTDATKWCYNPWEIAKCFMPPDGYKDVISAVDTDFNGLISVIVNFKGFDKKINDDLSKKNNIFAKGRNVGKSVRHSPKLEVNDADLKRYFKTLNDILTDPGFIALNKQNNAIQKLAKLQTDELIIGKDVVRAVLEDVGNSIQEQIKNEIDEYKQKTEKQKLELIDKINSKVKDIDDKGNISLSKLKDAFTSSTDALESKVKTSIQEIEKQTRKMKRNFEVVANVGVKKIKKEGANVIKEIQKAAEKSRDTDSKVSEEIYRKQKEELRGDLIKFYRKTCSSIPLSPLIEEKETSLAGFYVMPDIVIVKQKSQTCNEEERTPIKSLKDLFSTGSGDQQEIYLSAAAGFGKTAFSKYLAITWCQAHCHDENYACLKDDDSFEALLDFEFLFLVLLRDCTSVCYIDDMIEQQITKKLPLSASLDEVSRREKCLIILDGLDEWTHPVNSCGEVSEKIPHRYVRDNCSIVTTTRPWKLGVSNLKTSQINKKVELVQLSAESTRQLEENALRKMTGVHDDTVLKSKTKDFNKVIRQRGLEHMQVVPHLLMYIVCLWCNNIPIGNSKHEIYTNIIEFLLSRTSKKNPKVKPSCESSASEIPEYFKSHTFCKQFYSLITSLAGLAYKTFFNETRENTLVFDRTVAEKYLLADDMLLSLNSGILSENRSQTLMEKHIKVSFSHKTVQEYFAAIFVSFHNDAQNTVVVKCVNVQDILNMSTIFEYVSKMNADRMCSLSHDFMSVINEDEKTRDYRTRTGVEYMYNTPLYSIQEMFMLCLQEMYENENIKLCLQDFFIVRNILHSEQSEQLQRLLKQNKANIKSLYINTRYSSSSLREIIDLFSLTDLSHIQKLFYDGDSKKEAEINLILFPSLHAVTLMYGEWTNDEESLSENLARLQNLQYLYLDEFTLSHTILETLFNFISCQKSIKQLTLQELDCKEHGRHDCQRLNLDLSKHSTLTELDLRVSPRLQLNISTPSLVDVTLRDINLDESSLLLSYDMLNIKRVELDGIEMSAGSLLNFIIVLENLPQSVTVEMGAIQPETEYKRVRENIRSQQTFHVIGDDKQWGTIHFKTMKQSKE